MPGQHKHPQAGVRLPRALKDAAQGKARTGTGGPLTPVVTQLLGMWLDGQVQLPAPPDPPVQGVKTAFRLDPELVGRARERAREEDGPGSLEVAVYLLLLLWVDGTVTLPDPEAVPA